MQLPCGRSRVRVLAEVNTKIFSDVGNNLTTSVSAGLSKDSGSIHLIHKIQSQEQHSLQILYTLELNLGPFPPDVTHFFPNDL